MTTTPRLTLAEVEEFLTLRKRDAGSLLCAYRQTDDPEYLREALERFPESPEVLSAALLFHGFQRENRQELIERLKTVDPDNALGHYLGALDDIEDGITEATFAELTAGAGKELEDFSMSACQTDEEAFVTAGYSPAEAKLIAALGMRKPGTFALHGLLKPLKQANEEALQSGDRELQGNLHDVRLSLARQLQGGGTVVDSLVGQNFERAALEADGSPEAQQRRAELQDERVRLGANANRVSELFTDPAVSETDWSFFFDRFKQFGEAAANEWLLERYE